MNMDRRDFMRMAGAGALGLAGMTAWGETKRSSLRGSRPNIVFIMADDLDAGQLGCYGGKTIATPNLDRLAREGMQFRTAYATPLCGPTRSMLLSGKYATRTGHWCNWGVFNTGSVNVLEDETFYGVLHDSGYRTGVGGKWSWDREGIPHKMDESCIFPRTIDFLPKGAKYDGPVNRRDPLWPAVSRYWHPCVVQNGEFRPTTKDDYGPDIFTDFLVDFAKRNKGSNKPFMFYYSMALPHAADETKPELPFPVTPTTKNKDRGSKRDMDAYVDVLVGRIVKGLEEAGVRDDTIIIFTSDNGGYGPRGKSTTCEPGVLVPFIVNCPGKIPARGLVDEMVSLADIFPTLAELAGAPYQEKVDGISFVPVLEGRRGKRDHVYSFLGGERIIRDRRWLLERNYENDFGTFYDCGKITAGTSYDDPTTYYKDVTNSRDPEVVAAKERFVKIMEKYPAPSGVPRTWDERRQAELDFRKSKKQ